MAQQVSNPKWFCNNRMCRNFGNTVVAPSRPRCAACSHRMVRAG